MIRLIGLAAVLGLCALPLIHPFGPVKQQQSSVLPPDLPDVMRNVCRDCHSQKTEWPFYSYLPLASWAIEKDVADGRSHMDFSRWNRYTIEERQDLLARIGAEVRNHRMPLSRYVLLHPEARLSDAQIRTIYEWTKAQRSELRRQTEQAGE